jgi:hypothetical protein
MEKIQHAASKGTFQIAAFGNDIKKTMVLSEKTILCE